MKPGAINRNLHRVPLLPYDPTTQQLYVTCWGDEIVRWITGKIPRVEQSSTNKIEQSHEITDQQK